MPNEKDQFLLTQIDMIAKGLSETFSPFSEIVVHDLTNPDHSILTIYNNLSGRHIGDPATELGLARITSETIPNIISNYSNQFNDGRPAKSTSIGIKNNQGQYIAALCINVDLTLFHGVKNALEEFTQIKRNQVVETIKPVGAETIRKYIDRFAAQLATTPRTLKITERQQLMRELKENGLLDIKKSMEIVAQYLGISRAMAYIYNKKLNT